MGQRIYNHPYAEAGHCVGHVEPDGRIYSHPHANAGYCVGHIAQDGRIYNHPHAEAGYCIGHIAQDGRVYNHPHAEAGYCIGHVEGGYSQAGAAALLLFRLSPVPETPQPKIPKMPRVPVGRSSAFGEFLVFLPILIGVCLIAMFWQVSIATPALPIMIALTAAFSVSATRHKKRGDLSTDPATVAAAKQCAYSWALLFTLIPATITLVSMAAIVQNAIFLIFLPLDYFFIYMLVRYRMLSGKMRIRPLFNAKPKPAAKPPVYNTPPVHNQPPVYNRPPVTPKQPVYGNPHHSDGTYNYFICIRCGATLRVPMGKGKIQLTCPKCRYSFIVND